MVAEVAAELTQLGVPAVQLVVHCGELFVGRLARTTRALDEAAERVSRYLLMQSIVNVSFGIGVGAGLLLIGVPYALLWAVLASVMRFIPYVGPLIGALAPILVSLAVLGGWTRPVPVVVLFVVLELFTNLVLETFLYAGCRRIPGGSVDRRRVLDVAVGATGPRYGDAVDRLPGRPR
jgi:uncharacterized RDD family membrane protein YckC